MNSQPDSPIYLSREELETFNQLWQELPAEDREQLAEMIRRVAVRRAGSQEGGEATPFYILLLRVLLEEHREIKRLRQRLKDLQA